MEVPDAEFGDDEGILWEASVVALHQDGAQLHFEVDDKKFWYSVSQARQWLVQRPTLAAKPPEAEGVDEDEDEEDDDDEDDEEEEMMDEDEEGDSYSSLAAESVRKALREAEVEGLTLERAENTSGFKHVHKHVDSRGCSKRARYKVYVSRNGRRQYLGTFDTAEQGALKAARNAQLSAHESQEAEAASVEDEAGCSRRPRSLLHLLHTPPVSDAAQDALARDVLRLHRVRAALQEGNSSGAPFDVLREHGYVSPERELPEVEAGWRTTQAGHRHLGQLGQRPHGDALVLVLVVGWLPRGEDSGELFKVVHADGDAEDLDEGEVRRALALWRFDPRATAAEARATELAATEAVAVRQAAPQLETSECTTMVVASTEMHSAQPAAAAWSTQFPLRSPSPSEDAQPVCTYASTSSDQLPADPLAATLRDKFKHEGFRGQQRAVIEAVLAGRDALVVWPVSVAHTVPMHTVPMHTQPCTQYPCTHRPTAERVSATSLPPCASKVEVVPVLCLVHAHALALAQG